MNKIAVSLAILVFLALAALGWQQTQKTLKETAAQVSDISSQLSSVQEQLNVVSAENAKTSTEISALERSLLAVEQSRTALLEDHRRAAESALNKPLDTPQEVHEAVSESVNESVADAEKDLAQACSENQAAGDLPCGELSDAAKGVKDAARQALAANSEAQMKAAKEAVDAAGKVVADQLASLLDQLSAKRAEYDKNCKEPATAESDQCKALNQAIQQIETAIRAMKSLDSAKSTLDAILNAGLACGTAYVAYTAGEYAAAAAAGPSCLKALLDLLKLLGAGGGGDGDGAGTGEGDGKAEGQGSGPSASAQGGGVDGTSSPPGATNGGAGPGALQVVCGNKQKCNQQLRFNGDKLEVVTDRGVVQVLNLDQTSRSLIQQARASGKKFSITRKRGNDWLVSFGNPEANTIPLTARETTTLLFNKQGDLTKD